MNCKHCGADLTMKRAEFNVDKDGNIKWVRCPYDCLAAKLNHRVIEIRSKE